MSTIPSTPDPALAPGAEILTETLSGMVPPRITEPALPEGASEATGEWAGWFDPPGTSFRFIVTPEHTVGDRAVIGYVTQEEDGRCGDPKVYVDSEVGLHDGLSPAEARLTAESWQIGDDGRPVRRLSDGSTQQTITAVHGHEHLGIGATVNPSEDHEDEIGVRAWWQEDGKTQDSVWLFLTVEQARDVIGMIELAIERRAALRGAK